MKVINVLMAIIASLVFIGCSSVGPVSSSIGGGDENSVVNVTVTTAPLGVLAKALASNYPDSPSKILFTTNPIRSGHTTDTLYLSGVGPSYSCSLLGFERGKDYVINASAVSADYGQFGQDGRVLGLAYNIGSTSISIGDNAEVSASIAMKAIAHKLKASVPIKGTPVALSATSVLVIASSSDLGGGAPYRDTSKATFAVGAVDTVKTDRIIPLHTNPIDGLTTYNIEVIIDCGDGGYYKGNGNIDISASNSSSLTITLVKYGGVSSLAKMTITMNSLGEVLVTVSYP